MEARTLESPNTRESLVQVRIDHGDVIGLHPNDLIDQIRYCLAEKIAQSLFEKVEPGIYKALKETTDAPKEN